MGHGGARYGAGRPGWRVKAETCRRLDVRDLQRAGCLVAGYSGLWVWRNDARHTSFSIAPHALTLRHDLESGPMTQTVPILRTPCNFGGQRPWFGCPACGRRVAVLFLRPRGFVCRPCGALAFASQSEGVFDRALRSERKARGRLQAGYRSGTHASTHRKLLDRVAECEARKLAAFVAAVHLL